MEDKLDRVRRMLMKNQNDVISQSPSDCNDHENLMRILDGDENGSTNSSDDGKMANNKKPSLESIVSYTDVIATNF